MSLLPNELEEMLGTKEEFEHSKNIDEDGDDLMEENNKLDLMESQREELEDDDDEMTLGSMDRF